MDRRISDLSPRWSNGAHVSRFGHMSSAHVHVPSDHVNRKSSQTSENTRSRSISQHSDLLDPDKTNDAISATENNGDNISKIDVEDSLQKSYNQMRSKLNQLEEYNKTLENQLASIFQTINATVQTEPSDARIDTEFQDEIANPPVMSCSSKVETPRLKTKPPVNIKSTDEKNEVVVKPRRVPRRHSETDKNDKNSILQLTAHCHESEMSRDKYSASSALHQTKKNNDLSSVIRELRVSDLGDLKRAVLMRKTQRSLSVSDGSGPNIESFINDNGLLSHKHELHLNPSDLNNNEQSDESKEKKASTSVENLSSKSSSPPTIVINPDQNRFNQRKSDKEHNFEQQEIDEHTTYLGRQEKLRTSNTEEGENRCEFDANQQLKHSKDGTKSDRLVGSKRYFSPKKSIKTERSKSTGEGPSVESLMYQFYPSSKSSHQQRFSESWHQKHVDASDICENKSKPLVTLENIIEDIQDKNSSDADQDSSSYFTLADLKNCRSARKLSMQISHEILLKSYSRTSETSNHQNFQFVPSIFSSQSTFDPGSSFKSSSSFFPSSNKSSFSSIYASTTDYFNTDEDTISNTSSQFFADNEEGDLCDEFFLFPYNVLDADFDTICLELARYSPDIENCLQKSIKMGQLKAAKASDEWNTLWIYRGV